MIFHFLVEGRVEGEFRAVYPSLDQLCEQEQEINQGTYAIWVLACYIGYIRTSSDSARKRSDDVHNLKVL